MKKSHTKLRTACLPLFSLLAILASPAGLKAGTLTDLGTTVPTPGASDQSDLTPDQASGISNAYTNVGQLIGQSFTTGANASGYTLNDFIVEFSYNYTYGGGTLSLPAYVFLGSGITGTQLASDSGTLTESALSDGGSDGGLNGHFIEFTFSTPISLAANTQYSFALGNQTEGGGGAAQYTGTKDASTYSGGTAFVGSGTANDGNGNNYSDLVFDAGLTPITASVPEPKSTCAMLLGGAGFLIFGRRRRRAMV